jgi:hypothetical protein
MEYFLLKPNGEQTGTYSMEQVKEMVRTGFIPADTRFWSEGMATWELVDQIDESLKYSQPPPAPPSTTAPVRRLPAYSRIVTPGGAKPPPKTASTSLPLADEVLAENKPAYLPPPSSSLSNGHGRTIPANNLTPALGEPAPTGPAPDFAASVPEKKVAPAWIGSAVRIARFFLYALPMFALAVGIVIAVLNLPQPDARPPYRRITLNGSNNYALTGQDAIRTFSHDLQSSPALDSLIQQISSASDPSVQDRLNMGVEKERIRHADDVRRQYIEGVKAELVEPGTYRIVGDFDDSGALVLPREGEHWVAILYRGGIVYVEGTPDPGLTR